MGSEFQRQVLGPDLIAGSKNHGALDDVLDLPHIAGPVIIPENLHSFGAHRDAIRAAYRFQEMLSQRLDVFGSLANWRKSHRKIVDAEKKITSELSFRRVLIKIA